MKKYKTKLIEGDCLKIMPLLEESSFDLICADPPYQVTQCAWDKMIPFDNHIYVDVRGKKKLMYRDEYLLHMAKSGIAMLKFWKQSFEENCIPGMWENIKRVLKPNGAVVLFGSQPFTSKVIMSNLKWFKYEWIWEKNIGNNFASAKYRPMKEHENVLVFYKKFGTYNPQLIFRTLKSLIRCPVGKTKKSTPNKRLIDDITGIKKISNELRDDGKRQPKSVLQFDCVGQRTLHPTQKPVALMEYLIKTYTNQGDSVLDFCMGSGTAGVACQNTGRNFTGIELEKKYFKIAQQRMKENNVLLVRG